MLGEGGGEGGCSGSPKLQEFVLAPQSRCKNWTYFNPLLYHCESHNYISRLHTDVMEDGIKFDIHKGTVTSIVCHTLEGVYFCIIVFILMETASGFLYSKIFSFLLLWQQHPSVPIDRHADRLHLSFEAKQVTVAIETETWSWI